MIAKKTKQLLDSKNASLCHASNYTGYNNIDHFQGVIVHYEKGEGPYPFSSSYNQVYDVPVLKNQSLFKALTNFFNKE